MTEFFKKHLIHFILFIFEASFTYLHKSFDIYYDFDCQQFTIESKKEGAPDA